MAEKQAVFTLKVDTGNSVQDVQNFDHAVQSLNKDLKETQATASQQTGFDGFESKLQELDERLKAGGLSMREMTKLMKEYQTCCSTSWSASASYWSTGHQ
jgi:fructose-bisphosphate aldolase class 1